MRHRFGVALVVLGLICFAQEASAQKVGPEFKVNTTQAYYNLHASVAVLNDGSFVIGWMNVYYGDADFYQSAFGRRYGADGTPAGKEFRFGIHNDYYQGNPVLTALDDGGLAAVWSYYDAGFPHLHGLYGQRYNAAGQRVGPEFQVVGPDEFNVQGYSVARLSNGGFVVVWNIFDTSSQLNSAYGQRYDSTGQRSGSTFPIATGLPDGTVKVAGMASGSFVVVWVGKDNSKSAVYAQRYNTVGTAVGGTFRANSFTLDEQTGPSVAALTRGGFVVTWRSRGEDGSGYGIYGQRYSAVGAPVGGEFRVNTYTNHDQYGPHVSGLKNGGFVIAWTSVDQEGTDSEVYGQRYSVAGVKVGGEFRINTFKNGRQNAPSVASLGDGFVAAWTSYKPAVIAPWDGLYGQRFMPD